MNGRNTSGGTQQQNCGAAYLDDEKWNKIDGT